MARIRGKGWRTGLPMALALMAAGVAACGEDNGSPTGPSAFSVNHRSSEDALRAVAAEIDREAGRPLEGFTVIADSRSVSVTGDTYSASYRAEARQVFDLQQLRDRILARATGWRSGDVVLDDDSLDITFEKRYPAVTVRSAPRVLTAINYDVDITLR